MCLSTSILVTCDQTILIFTLDTTLHSLMAPWHTTFLRCLPVNSSEVLCTIWSSKESCRHTCPFKTSSFQLYCLWHAWDMVTLEEPVKPCAVCLHQTNGLGSSLKYLDHAEVNDVLRLSSWQYADWIRFHLGLFSMRSWVLKRLSSCWHHLESFSWTSMRGQR